MILAKLCELARKEQLLSNPDYEPKPVAWIIVVSDEGKFVNAIPTSDESGKGKKPRAKVLVVPRRTGRTSAAVADFLVDKSEYVLGVEPDNKRSEEDLGIRRQLFLDSVRRARECTNTGALKALEAFLENEEERAKAAEKIEKVGYKSNDLFAFEHGGGLVHELVEVRDYFSQTRRGAGEGGVQCLVCGKIAQAVDKHAAVKVPGGTTSGVALVSFNSEAFESHGLSRNENAPVCLNCADAYTTALSRLLSDRYPDPKRTGGMLPRRNVRLSPDTTALYWAENEASVVDLLTEFFEAPRTEIVGALLEAPRKGRIVTAPPNRFYCLIISGSQGRALLRGMHTGMVEEVEENMRAYFASIDIGLERPQPLLYLMRGLVLQGKLENLPPGLVTDVFLAILLGRRFPQTLLAMAVGRCKAERKVSRERAAMVRAYLIRNLKQEVSVGLDKNNASAGYRLGRLMALLERIQGTAQNNPNKTIVDRYYGAASSRPATVFPRLIANGQHHLAKLKSGVEVFYQRGLGEVLEGIASFPATLSLEEQGQFALGYYHQRQDFYKKTESESEKEKGEAA